MTVMDPGDDYPSATDPHQQIALTEGPTPVPRLAAEQIAAFSAFYRADIDRLVTFLRWYGADFTESVDVAQETMMKAFQRWGTLTNPAAWVRTVASRDFIRRRVRSVEDATEEVPESKSASGLLRDNTSAIAVEEQDEELRVLQLLALLPPRQRQVMAWTYDGYTPAEIAAQLSTPEYPLTPEAVRASLKLGRRKLAEHLGPGKDQS